MAFFSHEYTEREHKIKGKKAAVLENDQNEELQNKT